MAQGSLYCIDSVPVGATVTPYPGGSFKLDIDATMPVGAYQIKLSRDNVAMTKPFAVA